MLWLPLEGLSRPEPRPLQVLAPSGSGNQPNEQAPACRLDLFPACQPRRSPAHPQAKQACACPMQPIEQQGHRTAAQPVNHRAPTSSASATEYFPCGHRSFGLSSTKLKSQPQLARSHQSGMPLLGDRHCTSVFLSPMPTCTCGAPRAALPSRSLSSGSAARRSGQVGAEELQELESKLHL